MRDILPFPRHIELRGIEGEQEETTAVVKVPFNLRAPSADLARTSGS